MMTDVTQGTQPGSGLEVLKADALVERMKAQNPKLAGEINDKRMAAIVRGAVQALATELNEREEGRLRVPGLGVINISQIEREKDGQVLRSKRVMLRPAQPKV